MITENNYEDYKTLHEIKNKRIYYKDKVKKIMYLTFIGLSALDLTVMYNLGKITNLFATNELDKGMFNVILSFLTVAGIIEASKVSNVVKDKYNLKYFKKDHPEIDTEIKDDKIAYELAKYKEKTNSKVKDNSYDEKIVYNKEEDFFAYLVKNKDEKEDVKIKQKLYR